jgi:hypothetical protein
VARFAYLTDWRKKEVVTLIWSDVRRALLRSGALATILMVASWTHGEAPATGFARTMTSETVPPTLPEHRGLAARYPRDQGLRDDPSVVFADDFETSTGPHCRTDWPRTIELAGTISGTRHGAEAG